MVLSAEVVLCEYVEFRVDPFAHSISEHVQIFERRTTLASSACYLGLNSAMVPRICGYGGRGRRSPMVVNVNMSIEIREENLTVKPIDISLILCVE
jgi:hypothetical protein